MWKDRQNLLCRRLYIMRVINLASGEEVIVDDEDYDLVSRYKWARKTDGRHQKLLYAQAHEYHQDKQRTNLFMHRLVMGVSDPRLKVDHINHNGLDNRKANLRIANPTENQGNRRKTSAHTASRFKGVSWHSNRWRARIMRDGIDCVLGYFECEEDAARAYDKAALEHFGEYASINNPQSCPTNRPSPDSENPCPFVR